MKPLLVLERVRKYFSIRHGLFLSAGRHIRAVDDVSLTIGHGEAFGLVGESGSGKTTLARLIPRLTRVTGGKILYDGHDLTRAGGRELTHLRRQMGIIFQDPASSLNPRAPVRTSIMRPLMLQGIGGTEARRRLDETVALVNLGTEVLDRYPHQLSGGQQQRACIARAIILRPQLLILDEPTSALDVSVQAQILNLLQDLQAGIGMTNLFITHNLAVVRYMSDRIGVMYLGKLVEVAPTEVLHARPLHPYTAALLSASPPANPRLRERKRYRLAGDPPSLITPPPGCRLHPRCPVAIERCSHDGPELVEADHNRQVACHRWEELTLTVDAGV
ncbi:MAG: Oligopeptide transport ATP-binding protein OppF [candidate division WS2 bacterium]|nr:Oligopeptide transport ATP-binding protein OppF [Candidatus Psychracetigena formicireducens]